MKDASCQENEVLLGELPMYLFAVGLASYGMG